MIWVTGARGMLGACVVSALQSRGHRYLATDVDELDITDAGAVDRLAAEHPPSVVLNCAAYTNVDAAEQEPAVAAATNAEAVGHIAAAAVRCGAAVLHVSTDYVFDGAATTPYTEAAATAPLGVYGRTKLAGEQRLAAAVGGWAAPAVPAWVVRTSWLFGPRGRDFVGGMVRRLSAGTDVSVVDDQHGRPTYAPDLAGAMLALAGLAGSPAAPSGIYHFANTGETTWYGLTVAIQALLAAPATVTPTTTAAFPRPAPRPAYSVLATDKLEAATGQKPRPWREALAECLARRAELE